jgi:N-acetylglutamate synthase-like GNAT family acetyltransferase
MLDIRPFRQEDFAVLADLANQAAPFAPEENAVWLERRKAFDESKRIRRHYIATETNQPVGYGCLEQQDDDPTSLRIYVVCSPAQMHGEVGNRLYARLIENAIELGAATLWAREFQADVSIRAFFKAHGFVETRHFTLPASEPMVMFELDLRRNH